MKFFCEACEGIRGLADFRVEEDTLWVRCAQCGHDTRGVQPSSAARSPPSDLESDESARALPLPVVRVPSLAVPADAEREGLRDLLRDGCPKCGAPRPESAHACPRCGLLYVNFSPEAFAPNETLRAAWEVLGKTWDDPGAHVRFLELAEGEDALPAAGRLYRLRLAEAPGDAVAQQGRDEVLRRAMRRVALEAPTQGPSWRAARGWRRALVGWVLFVVVLLVVLRLWV